MTKFDVNKPYYTILGLDSSATQEEISRAYQKKKDALHPDNHEEKKDIYKFLMEDVQEAYDAFSDLTTKLQYDAARRGSNFVPINEPVTPPFFEPINNGSNYQQGFQVSEIDNSAEARSIATEGRRKVSKLSVAIVAVLIALGIALTGLISSCGKKDKDIKDDKTTSATSAATTNPDNNDGLILDFTDEEDKKQLEKRAKAIHSMLLKAGIEEYSIEDVINYLMFINGSYYADTEDHAYDMANEVLMLMGDYGTSVKGVTNFAGEELNMNDVKYAIKLNAFLVDDSPHAAILNDIASQFIRLVTAQTREEIAKYSHQLLTLEGMMMIGTYVSPEGKETGFFEMDDAEQFVAGIMFHIVAPTITTSLGENYSVTVGEDKSASRKIIEEYYNPMCDEVYDTENVWAKAYNGLVVSSLMDKGQSLTLKK